MMQPNTVATSSQPQTQQITIAPAVSSPTNNPQSIQNHRNVLRNLGITEVILGVLSIIFGIIVIATINSPCHSYYSYGYCRGITVGEGIWCGIWIIIAGGLGIPCGKNNSSKCLINTHMAFSIVGAVFSAVLFALSVTFVLVNSRQRVSVGLYSVLCLFSFTSMTILIVSASYCCVVQGCTCCSQPDVQPLYCGQMVCAQQPLANQQIPSNQPLVVQFHQPSSPGNPIAMKPGLMQPGIMQTGMMQTGIMQPGMMQPGIMQTGVMQTGMMQPTLNVNNPYSQNMQSNAIQVPQQNLNGGYTADVPPSDGNYLPA